MTRGPYETSRLSELEDAKGWSPIRKHFDIQAFGVNAWKAAEAGGHVIPDHDEKPSGHEELYLAVSGHATFTVEGNEIDAPAGTIVFVSDPAAMRAATAREAGTTVLSIGGKPGEAYRPRAWETNAEVLGLFDAGDFAGAKRVLIEALERYEDRGTLFYNLACAEAQLGEIDAAVEHIRAAIKEQPEWADSAREDEDLAPLRDDPRFAEAVGA
ncbi:MAG: tetratricopeptide repeat protein [Actinomycetota bacterium]|nr:tetratricopeptide repeat protein [Actinomycetota bacterium]